MPPVPCTVKGVFVARSTLGASPTVILSVENGTCLPIYIGLFEAMSIHSALREEIPPRPLTHDLFVELLRQLEISCTALIIDSIDEGVFYANMLLEKDHHGFKIDCRPSDGIAIGIRCKAEILVEEEVISESAIRGDELPDLEDISSYFSG